MSVLSEILATKRSEVALRQEQIPAAVMQEWLLDAPPPRDFRAALSQAKDVALIAEVKKASPSKGVIREDFDPIAIAKIYAENGATCLSVLTDTPYFQGKLEYLSQIRTQVTLPILRKDFTIDPWQVVESRAAGADAILLIVAALSPPDLRSLLSITREYGMAALVEVHDRDEMVEALNAGADLIGINNRDLHTFRTTLTTTLNLLAEFPPDPGRFIVSESGIFTGADVKKLQAAGVDAILVGEALMREADIGAKVRELVGSTLSS
jgi:indole-3-glycerol phosphate synthase